MKRFEKRKLIRLKHLFNFLWLFFGFAIFVLKIVRKWVLVSVVVFVTVVAIVEVVEAVDLLVLFAFQNQGFNHIIIPS